MTTQTEKAGAPAIGNAVAYFVVMLWMVKSDVIAENQAPEAIAMAGAIIAWLIFQVRSIIGFFADLIRRRYGKDE